MDDAPDTPRLPVPAPRTSGSEQTHVQEQGGDVGSVPVAESGGERTGDVATNAPPVGKGGRVSQNIVTLRVSHFARFLTMGHTRAKIIQNVAKLQQDEAAKRRKYRDAGAEQDEIDAEVPFVWGDDPMQTRTLDDYIKRAKKLVAEDARKLAPQREFILGRTMNQLDELYSAAFAKKAYHVCHDCIETTIKLFGLDEAVRMILAHTTGAGAENATHDDARKFTTDAAKSKKLSELMSSAVQNDPTLLALFARRGFVTASSVSTDDDAGPPPPERV